MGARHVRHALAHIGQSLGESLRTIFLTLAAGFSDRDSAAPVAPAGREKHIAAVALDIVRQRLQARRDAVRRDYQRQLADPSQDIDSDPSTATHEGQPDELGAGSRAYWLGRIEELSKRSGRKRRAKIKQRRKPGKRRPCVSSTFDAAAFFGHVLQPQIDRILGAIYCGDCRYGSPAPCGYDPCNVCTANGECGRAATNECLPHEDCEARYQVDCQMLRLTSACDTWRCEPEGCLPGSREACCKLRHLCFAPPRRLDGCVIDGYCRLDQGRPVCEYQRWSDCGFGGCTSFVDGPKPASAAR